jgi:ADP-heptose:LPS heptosyltransferase
MTTIKKLGICLDHSSAHLIEFTTALAESKTVDSKFTHQQKEQTLGKSENLMHNKEQHEQAEYYKKLGEAILNYNEVLLFGPTEAKAELFNILRADHRFAKIKIEVKPADKMNEIQQRDFVQEYFSQRLSSSHV